MAAARFGHGGEEAAAVRQKAGYAEVIGSGRLFPVGGLLLPGGAVVSAGPGAGGAVALFFQQQKVAVLQKHWLFIAAGAFAGGDLLLPPAAGGCSVSAAPGGRGRSGAGGRLPSAAEKTGSQHCRQRKAAARFARVCFFMLSFFLSTRMWGMAPV